MEGDPRYTNFRGEVHFVATGDGKKTQATWTGKYDPVGNAGSPEHIKDISALMFKTFEKAILAKKTLTHTETLDATPDAIWKAVQNENTILPKALPQIFESLGHSVEIAVLTTNLHSPLLLLCDRLSRLNLLFVVLAWRSYVSGISLEYTDLSNWAVQFHSVHVIR